MFMYFNISSFLKTKQKIFKIYFGRREKNFLRIFFTSTKVAFWVMHLMYLYLDEYYMCTHCHIIMIEYSKCALNNVKMPFYLLDRINISKKVKIECTLRLENGFLHYILHANSITNIYWCFSVFGFATTEPPPYIWKMWRKKHGVGSNLFGLYLN